MRIIFVSVILLISTSYPYAQNTADGRWLPDGTWQPRNPNATIDINSDYDCYWTSITDWGNEIYVTDTLGGYYVNPRLAVSDSVLHLFSKGFNEPHQYVSYDNGNSWEFFASYIDSTFNIDPVIINVFCDNNRVYTTWSGRRGNENIFVYFRASSDYGVTWPITAEIIERPLYWRDARYGNVSGCGDTVFVSFEEDSLACWRSSDMGVTWDDLGYIADIGYGVTYPPSITYSGGAVNIVYNPYYQGQFDIFYINSYDHGDIWNEPLFLGFDDGIHGLWPEIGADSMGNIAVCWMDYMGSPYMWQGGIWIRVSHDSGMTWNAPVRLDNDYRGNPGVTVAVDNNYIGVVWTSNASIANGLMQYRESWDGGTTWSQEIILSNGWSTVPRLSKKDNTLHLVWRKDEFVGPEEIQSFVKYIFNDELTGIDPSVFEGHIPEDFKISSFPNPFNSTTTLIISPRKGGDAEINIYDLTGALVKTISTKEGIAIWDATDNSGRSVSSGIYFVRVVTPQTVVTKKLLYLR